MSSGSVCSERQAMGQKESAARVPARAPLTELAAELLHRALLPPHMPARASRGGFPRE